MYRYLFQVQKILTDDAGRVCGVQVKKGKEVFSVAAPMVISDAGRSADVSFCGANSPTL